MLELTVIWRELRSDLTAMSLSQRRVADVRIRRVAMTETLNFMVGKTGRCFAGGVQMKEVRCHQSWLGQSLIICLCGRSGPTVVC